jgi:hypothetical protein
MFDVLSLLKLMVADMWIVSDTCMANMKMFIPLVNQRFLHCHLINATNQQSDEKKN